MIEEVEFDFENRIVSTEASGEDTDVEISLRPKVFDEYIGQEKVKDLLKVYIEAAKGRGDSLDHVLLYGPPGLGKTTLSGIIAAEMGVNFRVTSGPAIEKQGDLAAILTNLAPGDVLFIDEIHRLSRSIEEILYPAMEDYVLDIIIGKGPAARSIRVPLPRFTLVGATTRAGQLTTPLRDRFGVLLKLELYSHEELATIVKRSASLLEVEITDGLTVKYIPFWSDDDSIMLAHGEKYDEIMNAFEARSAELHNGKWLDGWRAFCVEREEGYRKMAGAIGEATPETWEKQKQKFAHYLDCEAHTDVWRELYKTWNHTNK